MKKLTLEDIQETARKRGGKCLATEYKNQTIPVLWECAEGHQWMATPREVRRNGGNGTWCPYCGGNAKYTMEEVHAIAARRGGKCLSEYKNNQTKLEWECAKGHHWKAILYNIIGLGYWCPVCAKEKKAQEKLEKQ